MDGIMECGLIGKVGMSGPASGPSRPIETQRDAG